MSEWKKVVCAVDFSETSRAACDAAVELCAGVGAELTLLHVHPLLAWVLPDGVVPVGAETWSRFVADVEAKLGEWRRRYDGRGVTIHTATASGHVAASIVAFAAEGAYDLVVLGTHGRSGVDHALLGSVAEKVVRLADRPVLTVRAGGQP